MAPICERTIDGVTVREFYEKGLHIIEAQLGENTVVDAISDLEMLHSRTSLQGVGDGLAQSLLWDAKRGK